MNILDIVHPTSLTFFDESQQLIQLEGDDFPSMKQKSVRLKQLRGFISDQEILLRLKGYGALQASPEFLITQVSFEENQCVLEGQIESSQSSGIFIQRCEFVPSKTPGKIVLEVAEPQFYGILSFPLDYIAKGVVFFFNRLLKKGALEFTYRNSSIELNLSKWFSQFLASLPMTVLNIQEIERFDIVAQSGVIWFEIGTPAKAGEKISPPQLKSSRPVPPQKTPGSILPLIQEKLFRNEIKAALELLGQEAAQADPVLRRKRLELSAIEPQTMALALSLLTEEINKNPDDLLLYLLRASISLKKTEWTEAFADYLTVSQKYEQRGDKINAQIALYYAAKIQSRINLDQSMALCQKGVTYRLSWLPFYELWLQNLEQAQRKKEQILVYQMCLMFQADPLQQIPSYLKLASLYLKENRDLRRAKKCLNQVLRYDQVNIGAVMGFAEIALFEGKTPNAAYYADYARHLFQKARLKNEVLRFQINELENRIEQILHSKSAEKLAEPGALSKGADENAFRPVLPKRPGGPPEKQVALEKKTAAIPVVELKSPAVSDFTKELKAQGNFQGALDAYEKAIEQLKSAKTSKLPETRKQIAQYYFEIAEIYHQALHQEAGQLEALKEGFQYDKTHPAIFKVLTLRYLEKGLWPEIKADFLNGLQYDVPDPHRRVDYYRVLSTNCLLTKQFEEAEEIANLALKTDPGNGSTIELLGTIYKTTLAWDKLVKLLNTELLRKENLGEKAKLLAEIALIHDECLWNKEEAYNIYKQSYEFRPGQPEVLEKLARISQTLFRWNEAIFYLTKLAEQTKPMDKHCDILTRIAVIYKNHLKNTTAATEYFQKAISIKIGTKVPSSFKGPEAPKNQEQKITAGEPKEPAAAREYTLAEHKKLIAQLIDKADYEVALNHIETVLRKYPEDIELLQEKRLVFDKKNFHAKFLEVTGTLFQLTRHQGLLTEMVAYVKDHSLQDLEGVEHLLKVFELAPEFSPVFNMLVYIYEKKHLKEEMISLFEKRIAFFEKDAKKYAEQLTTDYEILANFLKGDSRRHKEVVYYATRANTPSSLKLLIDTGLDLVQSIPGPATEESDKLNTLELIRNAILFKKKRPEKKQWQPISGQIERLLEENLEKENPDVRFIELALEFLKVTEKWEVYIGLLRDLHRFILEQYPSTIKQLDPSALQSGAVENEMELVSLEPIDLGTDLGQILDYQQRYHQKSKAVGRYAIRWQGFIEAQLKQGQTLDALLAHAYKEIGAITIRYLSDTKEGLKNLFQAYQLNPKDKELRTLILDNLIGAEHYSEALDFIDKLLRSTHVEAMERGKLQFIKGQVYFSRGDITASVKQIIESFHYGEPESETLAGLIQKLKQREDFKDLAYLLNEISRITPNSDKRNGYLRELVNIYKEKLKEPRQLQFYQGLLRKYDGKESPSAVSAKPSKDGEKKKRKRR